MNVREYLHSKGLRWEEEIRPSGVNGIMNCPFCDDAEKKFAINLDTGFFNCLHKNKCGVTGGYNKLRNLFGDKGVIINPDRHLAPKIKKKKYIRPKPIKDRYTRIVAEYFAKRYIEDDTLNKFRVAESEGAIAFQYFKDGVLVNIKYRKMDKKEFWTAKGCEPVLYNHDNVVGPMLTIVEGEIDSLSMYEYAIYNSVSIPSGVDDMRWIEVEWEWLEQFSRINICFDMDSAGREAVDAVVARLGRWRCYEVKLPLKDANACLMAGIKREEIVDAFDNAAGFEIEELVSVITFSKRVSMLMDNQEKAYGVRTAFSQLTKIIRGWRPAELTVWSGRNGSGKTTILNQIMVDLFEQKEICCIASLEMKPERLLKWLVYQIAKREDITSDEVLGILQKVDDYLYLVNAEDEITPDTILEIFAFAAKKYGVKHFFLDSLMMLAFENPDDSADIKMFVKKYVAFAVKYNVHVHLVAHPRKGATDDDKPGSVDISGTSNITNLAHNVLIVWRPSAEMVERAAERGKELPDSVLYCKKNREYGTTGSIKLKFSEKTKVLVELDF